MSNSPKFKVSLCIGKTNEERIEAFEMYQKAFGAEKTWESVPPDGGDIHIGMDINGFEFLIGPGGKVEKTMENAMCCEFHFDNETDLRNAYDVLIKDSPRYSMEGPFPWAKILGLVIDKFGIAWALYFNE